MFYLQIVKQYEFICELWGSPKHHMKFIVFETASLSDPVGVTNRVVLSML
jgi:hypothetical protein